MNDRQKIAVRSAKVVFTVCKARPATIALVPILGTRLTTAETMMNAFITADEAAIKDNKGYAIKKEQLRDGYTTELEMGYDAVTSLAIENHDPVLEQFANFTPTQFDAMGGEALIEAGNNLVTKIGVLGVDTLQPHGYKAEDLTDLQTTLAAFKVDVNTPETVIKEHKDLVMEREEKFKVFNDYMKGAVDKAAKPLKKKDADFYRLYRICRKLHLQGHRSIAEGGNAEYTKVVPFGRIILIDFTLAANKVYLMSNLGTENLKYFTLATADVPTTVPADAKPWLVGEELIKNSTELGFPDKIYLFVANESADTEGEVAISEVV